MWILVWVKAFITFLYFFSVGVFSINEVNQWLFLTYQLDKQIFLLIRISLIFNWGEKCLKSYTWKRWRLVALKSSHPPDGSFRAWSALLTSARDAAILNCLQKFYLFQIKEHGCLLRNKWHWIEYFFLIQIHRFHLKNHMKWKLFLFNKQRMIKKHLLFKSKGWKTTCCYKLIQSVFYEYKVT